MGRERLFEGKLFNVVRDDGKDLVVLGAAVAVVAIDRSNRVVFVRQDHVGAGGPLLELPAGGVEAGEPPLQAAQRELREETGLHGGDWIGLGSFLTTPGFCDERMHLFLATGLDEGEAAPDADEELEVVRVRLDEVPTLLAELDDAKTIVGLLELLRL